MRHLPYVPSLHVPVVDDPEQLVSPLTELAALIGAAAAGAIIAVTVIGASLLLALPAVVVVAVVALVTLRRDAG